MKQLAGKVELLANIAIVVVSLILGAALVNRYFFSTTPAEVQVGEKVSLPGVD